MTVPKYPTEAFEELAKARVVATEKWDKKMAEANK